LRLAPAVIDRIRYKGHDKRARISNLFIFCQKRLVLAQVCFAIRDGRIDDSFG